MKNYSKLYENATSENTGNAENYRKTEKRELNAKIPAEKNAKLSKRISEKKQKLSDIRKELITLKTELKKTYETVSEIEAERETIARRERLNRLLSIGSYCETLPFDVKGAELKKACLSIIENEIETFEIRMKSNIEKPSFSYWKEHTENTNAKKLIEKIDTLQGKNENLSHEIARLKKSYTLDSLLYIPTVRDFWKGTIFESYENYLIYLLIFRKSYNFKKFIETYETPIDELINVVTAELLKPEKIEKAEKILSESIDTDAVKVEKIKSLIANTTRRAMINFSRIVTLDVTISERAIDNERKRKKAEAKAHRNTLKAKKLATAGKVQRFVSTAISKNSQRKARKDANKGTLKGFSYLSTTEKVQLLKRHDRTVKIPFFIEHEKVVETVEGWKLENRKTESTHSYYRKNVQPLLEMKACLMNGTHESMRFENMESVTREIAPVTYERFFNERTVAEIAEMLNLSEPSIYIRLRNEKELLKAEFRRRA